ncbi:sensor histidine kinase [Halalkalibacter lacteus]|uniref:sensor histidine kinase n=1 Tax=Halalkalibacter lacteus TaxID=3090663 RepID=UPI002FCAF072
MAILGSIAYSQYTKSIEEQLGEYIPKLLKQSNENIENKFKELATLPDLIYNSESVVAILRKGETTSLSEGNRDHYIVRNFFLSTFLSSNNSEILGVFLTSNNQVFENSRLRYEGHYLENSFTDNEEVVLFVGDMQVLPPYQSDLVFEGKPPFFLLKKNIIDFDNRRTIGTLYIAVETAFIERVFYNLDNEDKADMWLMNRNGRILYHTDSSKIGTTYHEINDYPILNGSFHSNESGVSTLISLDETTNMDWILVHSIPTKFLTERADVVTNIIIILLILLVLVTTLISIYLALTVTRPISTLGRLMKDVEQGDFQVEIPIHSKDEVGLLARSFRSMVTKIRELIRINYQNELRQKNAEFYALQSQINPHFMYNTLETIGMAVEEGDSDIVVDMVTVLGRMLRFSLSNKDQLVQISKEVLHVRDYLSIQKFRFEDQLDFHIDETINCDDYYTPKFILQPIVENSIKYGFTKRGKLTIHIDVIKEVTGNGEDVLFIIRDDGPGIDRNKLTEIYELLELESGPIGERDSGFGISNVHARVETMFGKEYGVQINSEEGKGTEVVIRTSLIPGTEVSKYINSRGFSENGSN